LDRIEQGAIHNRSLLAGQDLTLVFNLADVEPVAASRSTSPSTAQGKTDQSSISKGTIKQIVDRKGASTRLHASAWRRQAVALFLWRIRLAWVSRFIGCLPMFGALGQPVIFFRHA
jgi:hypothetical protein